MKHFGKTTHAIALMLVVVLTCMSPAIAQVTAPPGQTQGAYVTGGIGQEDRAALLKVRKLYNVRLAFAEHGSGAYLTGVRVTVQGRGKAVNVWTYEDSGPLLYLHLQPGTYRFSAVYGGVDQQWTVHVGRHAIDRVIYWKAA